MSQQARVRIASCGNTVSGGGANTSSTHTRKLSTRKYITGCPACLTELRTAHTFSDHMISSLSLSTLELTRRIEITIQSTRTAARAFWYQSYDELLGTVYVKQMEPGSLEPVSYHSSCPLAIEGSDHFRRRTDPFSTLQQGTSSHQQQLLCLEKHPGYGAFEPFLTPRCRWLPAAAPLPVSYEWSSAVRLNQWYRNPDEPVNGLGKSEEPVLDVT